jgi:hypothetical protein
MTEIEVRNKVGSPEWVAQLRENLEYVMEKFDWSLGRALAELSKEFAVILRQGVPAVVALELFGSPIVER